MFCRRVSTYHSGRFSFTTLRRPADREEDPYVRKPVPRAVSIDDRLERFGSIIDTASSTGTYPIGHYHGGVEILLIHVGSIYAYTKFWSAHVQAGQALVLNGSQHHMVRPGDRLFERTAIHLLPHMAPSDTTAHFVETTLGTEGGKVLNLGGAAAHRIYWAAQELQSLGEGNGRTTDTARHLLALILNELAHADLAAVHAGTELSIANVIYYMRHHLDRTETIEDLATRFFVSERHLYRMFEEELGCSPKQYWLRLRMERAAQLLRTTDASTGEIAAAVGFSSISGFERAFRRVMQRSTAEVRAQSVD